LQTREYDEMGPLTGFRIVELAGIGPGQLCGMLLADMGAQLIRIERLADADLGIPLRAEYQLMNRSRPAIAVDLKRKEGVELLLQLCEQADALFEGFRPGVMERLGLGPDACMARNRRLVYGRMTGWGQDGPLAASVGHDGNYIALAGVLSTIGAKDGQPVMPLNLVADFGGGALFLALGILAALLESGRSGEGQVVDAAMIDGAASLMTLFYGLRAAGLWQERRASNILDGAAPFYRCYATQDDRSVAVCAIERRFFRALLEALSIDDVDVREQFDTAEWPRHAAIFESVFRTRTRDEWSKLLQGSDACVTPVLSMSEAPEHPHNKGRNTFVEIGGIVQPGPAPRFSRTASEIGRPPEAADAAANHALHAWGVPQANISRLLETGVIR
jgi:alpha-methylacyl-CoA racemase